MSKVSLTDIQRYKNKKRMMYIVGEDFYLYTYCIFNILQVFECFSVDKMFKDHRKLPFYINISHNKYVADIYSRYNKRQESINQEDKKLLVNCYYNSMGKDRIIYRLLTILESKGFIKIERNFKIDALDIYMKNNDFLKNFTVEDMFKEERDNLYKVKGFYKNGHKVALNTTLKNLFYVFKVGNWLL